MRQLAGVRIVREEVRHIPDDGIVIIATGPLTSPALSKELAARLGEEHLYFYDAISPIVSAESIDMSVAFRASRYDKGGDDYLNLPLTREEYHRFIDALLTAERVPTHSFERFVPFEGCMPIEEMADRGKETLAFGPMRAVGLRDPRTGKRPYAVVQLRQENQEKTLYNLVGFQTKMTYAEQRRVFALIPGLAQAEFVRLGSLHRNTFINAPLHLMPTLQWRQRATLFFAGQMTGVEGYIESAATGLLAGINAAKLIAGAADGHAAGDDRAGRTLALYYRSRAQTVSADERELRTDRAAHGAFTRQGKKGNDVAPGARRSGGVGARKRRGAG